MLWSELLQEFQFFLAPDLLAICRMETGVKTCHQKMKERRVNPRQAPLSSWSWFPCWQKPGLAARQWNHMDSPQPRIYLIFFKRKSQHSKKTWHGLKCNNFRPSAYGERTIPVPIGELQEVLQQVQMPDTCSACLLHAIQEQNPCCVRYGLSRWQKDELSSRQFENLTFQDVSL